MNRSTAYTPGTVILLCGKIASGKSYYARKLMAQSPTVLLSMDELFDLCELDFFNDLHNALYPKLQRYLIRTAAAIAKCGTDVILDSGFWTSTERQAVRSQLLSLGTQIQWHYIDVPEDTWRQNIQERNRLAIATGNEQFFIDETKMENINQDFEIPTQEEIDVWYCNKRVH